MLHVYHVTYRMGKEEWTMTFLPFRTVMDALHHAVTLLEQIEKKEWEIISVTEIADTTARKAEWLHPKLYIPEKEK